MHLLRPLQCGSSFLFVLFAPTLSRHFSAEVGLCTSTIFELRFFFLWYLVFLLESCFRVLTKNVQTPAPILNLAASRHPILLRPIGSPDCGWLRPSPTLATPSADVEGELLLHPVAYYPSVSAWHLQQLFDRGISFFTFTLSPTFFTT